MMGIPIVDGAVLLQGDRAGAPARREIQRIPSLIEVMEANLIYFGAVVTGIDLNNISSASSDSVHRRRSLTDHSR